MVHRLETIILREQPALLQVHHKTSYMLFINRRIFALRIYTFRNSTRIIIIALIYNLQKFNKLGFVVYTHTCSKN